ncbi:MAG: glucose-1-phosphate adenylyltransferase [Acutalibacteraceae bacterium]|nr:glucose-1-phosphate adenylyltransferase [Acutalibacteraceae bacterium]
MKRKTECVAMLLAGGEGSRLGVLTRKVAKPAIPFGGKYRIIDFPLSNCINSGIETVGVLTQYQPLELNSYIGSGAPWDLDRMNGGVSILPPYQKKTGTDWYKGTANAIYQNIPYIENFNPQYVLILSGDHIYKMDYAKMIKYHKEHDAACTIAVMSVPMEEAPRFGIMNTNEDNSVYEFEEKPANPKSNKASMGVYIFNWEDLKKYLIEDEADKESSNDFGKNIIPAMLSDGKKLFAYEFDGYWKDVGTIDSLWDANMDILNPNIPLDLDDKKWRIYARNKALPPHFVADTATIQNSLISDGCEVYGKVYDSVLFSGAEVEEGADVSYSVIMPGAKIKKGAVVKYSIVATNAVVESGAKVGGSPEDFKNDIDNWGITTIGPEYVVKENTVIPPKEMVEA